MSDAPRWDLTTVYPSLDSAELDAALSRIKEQIGALEQLQTTQISRIDSAAPADQIGALIGEAVRRLNELRELAGTVEAYLHGFVCTDSRDTVAMRKLSEFEQLMVPAENLGTCFTAWIGGLGEALEPALAADKTASAHAFVLREMADQARFLMTPPEEALATELALSGATAWSKLQGTVTSQLTVDFELDGEQQSLPMPALINLHSHADEGVRRRAYEMELKTWHSVREPLAAAMNGVKGAGVTLNRRRGRKDALHRAIDGARIDRATLQTMLNAMEASLPVFRRYFRAKAERLGQEKLAWWNIFAPTGRAAAVYSWPQARELVLTRFAAFSPDLGALARRAFDEEWIDAEPRQGKRGGAFCMGVQGLKQSRVLCNFDGTLDQVSTIAHELGHAFHNECAFAAGKTELQSQTPMTLAETASIMCETLIAEGMLAEADDPQTELAILEARLIGDAQVIVDIYSRYLFEQEVFQRRARSELSADDLCDIMERAQKATYGDGLDADHLHPYMWTWKPHYYYADAPFYNFPYAFGLLFGLGLYAVYQQRGADFVADYRRLLASTGEASVVDLAARFGLDIRQSAFWEDSLALIETKIDRYCIL
jgi:oligoendopeptidase F